MAHCQMRVLVLTVDQWMELVQGISVASGRAGIFTPLYAPSPSSFCHIVPLPIDVLKAHVLVESN